MCGIVGIYSKSPVSNRGLLVRMRDTMRHRGPDDAGEWFSQDGRVGLAHRRLSIIDLSAGGHQPMKDSAGGFIITFNGEIYNYQELRRELKANGHSFHTESDTEVLLESYRAWGSDCLSHLNGMFAFCIYDIKKQRLFLARDRAGEKPLFYTHQGGFFAFASELKALMAFPSFPRIIDLTALSFYFTYGYIPGDYCILQGFHKLPPGHAMSFTLPTSTLKIWKYWALPESKSSNNINIEELSEELESLLEDSVRRQLVADVPVGILLSGGVDSSLITAMAARVSDKPVKTFTVVFPGQNSFNEAPHAEIVARHFGTEHRELVAESASVSLLPELARQYDEPIADSSLIPTYLVSKLIRQSATVALGGDGGDELFGGYLSYNWIFKQEVARRYMPEGIRKMFSGLTMSYLPHGVRGRNFLLALDSALPQAYSKMNIFFDRRLRSKIIKPFQEGSDRNLGIPEEHKVNLCEYIRGLPGMVMALDFKTYLPDDILVKVDRASMLNSLEVRAPILDYRIIEFAFSRIPNSLKANIRKRKILLRHFAKKILPAQLNLERKQGFCIPLKIWFKSEFGEFIKNILCETDSSLFNRSEMLKLINNQNLGLLNSERLFALTFFELWRREYKATIPY